MTRRCRPLLVLAAVLLAGCSAGRTQALRDALPAAPAQPPPNARIAQFGFGAEAHFAPCVGDDCPRPTPKMLDVVPRLMPLLPAPPFPAPLLPAPTPLFDAASPAVRTDVLPPEDDVPR